MTRTRSPVRRLERRLAPRFPAVWAAFERVCDVYLAAEGGR
ncbi:hypothetical protein [Limnoglobus roseus]|nr:hypothetical protein [Limnoglobus roseus]